MPLAVQAQPLADTVEDLRAPVAVSYTPTYDHYSDYGLPVTGEGGRGTENPLNHLNYTSIQDHFFLTSTWGASPLIGGDGDSNSQTWYVIDSNANIYRLNGPDVPNPPPTPIPTGYSSDEVSGLCIIPTGLAIGEDTIIYEGHIDENDEWVETRIIDSDGTWNNLTNIDFGDGLYTITSHMVGVRNILPRALNIAHFYPAA